MGDFSAPRPWSGMRCPSVCCLGKTLHPGKTGNPAGPGGEGTSVKDGGGRWKSLLRSRRLHFKCVLCPRCAGTRTPTAATTTPSCSSPRCWPATWPCPPPSPSTWASLTSCASRPPPPPPGRASSTSQLHGECQGLPAWEIPTAAPPRRRAGEGGARSHLWGIRSHLL